MRFTAENSPYFAGASIAGELPAHSLTIAATTMLRRRTLRILRLVFLGLAFLSLAVGVGLLWAYQGQKGRAETHALEQANTELSQAVPKIDSTLRHLSSVSDSLARKLSSGQLSYPQVLPEMKRITAQYRDIFGTGTFFLEGVYPGEELFGPFWVQPEEAVVLRRVDTSYDYTQSDWFNYPLKHGPGWSGPWWAEVGQQFVAEYSQPIFRPGTDTVPVGVTLVDLSLDGLNRIVNNLELGRSGYGFLVGKDGRFFAHPINDWLKEERGIDHLATTWQDSSILELFRRGQVGGTNYIDLVHPDTGEEFRLFVREIPSNGWKLGAMFLMDDFSSNYQTRFRTLLRVGAAFTLTLLLLVVALALYKHQRQRRLWLSVTLATLVIAGGIAFTWYQELEAPLEADVFGGHTVINDRSVLQRFIQQQDSAFARQHEPLPIKIPTGVQVQNMQFDGAHTITLAGIIWQRYANNLPEDFQEGFFFPDQSSSHEIVEIEQLYRNERENETVVGWHFRVALKLDFSYATYPFDHQDVSLRLWPRSYNENVLLVPDLEAYRFVNARLKPGIDPHLSLRGWHLAGSFFDFEESTYNNTLGVQSSFSNLKKQELRFNVVLKRDFLGPFIQNIIPLMAILFLMFTVVLTATKDIKHDRVGFTGIGVVELGAAFFFVVVLSHLELRNSLDVEQIIYLDYFYFVMYFQLLVYSANSIVFSRSNQLWLVQYRNNLIPKLLFFPALLLVLYLITFFVFY